MASHTPHSADKAIGQNLFALFPELPKKWLERKLQAVFMLRTPAFSNWEQRNHLFNLPHNRPFTTESKYMAQNCTLLPMPPQSDGIEKVCILIEDATDVAFYQTQLRQTMRELEIANRIDGLTGAANRRFWEETLELEFNRAKRYGQDFSLIMFDIDYFKRVNDTFGHRVGDMVLIKLVAAIKPMLRTNDVLGRYGGEEFGILLPQTTLSDAQMVAERIRNEIQLQPMNCDDNLVDVSLSMGVDSMAAKYHHYDDLLTHADMALYHAKRNGRNQVVCYTHLHPHATPA